MSGVPSPAFPGPTFSTPPSLHPDTDPSTGKPIARVVVVGGSVRLASVRTICQELGCQPVELKALLAPLNLARARIGDVEYIHLYDLERALWKASHPDWDWNDIDDAIVFSSKYLSRCRKAAILEYIRSLSGAPDGLKAVRQKRRHARLKPAKPNRDRATVLKGTQ